MKKIIVFLLVLVLLCSTALAANNSNGNALGKEPFCGSSTFDSCTTDSDCASSGCSSQICGKAGGEAVTTCEYRDCYNSNSYKLSCACSANKCQWADVNRTVSQDEKKQVGDEVAAVKEEIQQNKEAFRQTLQTIKESQRPAYEGKNDVAAAVHALLELDGLTGGIGKNISAIARDFNNSIRSTLEPELKIGKRSGFLRFLAGGDWDAANEIDATLNQTVTKLDQLNLLIQYCECDPEVKLALQEQLQAMDQEQARLYALTGKERMSKGLFGWLWKR